MSHRGSVIQGSFLNGFPRVAAHGAQQPVQRAAAHPNVHVHAHPNAMQLPPQMAIQCATHGGQPLPPQVRQKMETAFRADFGDVRIHVGPQAQALGATAFTHGSHIHFAPGQWDPSSMRGQQALGRQLAHVVQQRTGRARNPFGSGVAIVQDRVLQAEAERMAMQATRPAPAPIQRIDPITGGLLAVSVLGAAYGVWRWCIAPGSSRRAYSALPEGSVPAHNGKLMRIPQGTSVFHGTTDDPRAWWRTSTPGLKNDEDGGVSFTLVPKSTPKVRNHDVIIEYRFAREVVAKVCASKADFHHALSSGEATVCYTRAEQEIKITMEDAPNLLVYASEYHGDPSRPKVRSTELREIKVV